MNSRSLARTISLPALLATALVGLLLLWLVPSRQLLELEKSTTAELQSMAAAFAVSVELAFEQQNLRSLANLSDLIREDDRALMAAVLMNTPQGEELLAEFPQDVGVQKILKTAGEDFLTANAAIALDD